MSSRPTTPAHRASRVAEAIQIAPYLTHIVRHHGQLTLIPPENEGRIRKEKGKRIAHNRSKSHSNLSLLNASQSPTSRSRALSSRPSSASLSVARPGLNESLRTRSENNVAISNLGTSSRRSDSLPRSAAETIPDFPPPTFEEAVAILNATTTGGETTRPCIEGSPGSCTDRNALVGSVPSSTRAESRAGRPPTIDIEIASDSESTSSSQSVVANTSSENIRAQQWEEDRIAGVFSLEERVRRELERQSRQKSLPPSEDISSATPPKGKEDFLCGCSEDDTLQGLSRKGKERATLGDPCPGSPLESVDHDWLFVDHSKSSGPNFYAGSSRTTDSDASSNLDGCFIDKARNDDSHPCAQENFTSAPSQSSIANEAELHPSPSCLLADPDLKPYLQQTPPKTPPTTSTDAQDTSDNDHDSYPYSRASTSGYISRWLPDTSISIENTIPTIPLHLTDAHSHSDIHAQDIHPSCISTPGTSSQATETNPVSLTHSEDFCSPLVYGTTTLSSKDQLSTLDEGAPATLVLSRLTARLSSPSPPGSSAIDNQSSGSIELSEVAVPNRSAALNSLSLSLTNRPLPCLPPPAVPRPRRKPPLPPTHRSPNADGSTETASSTNATRSSQPPSRSKPRRIPPPPPPPRRPRNAFDTRKVHENTSDLSINSGSELDNIPVILSPQPPEHAGSHELLGGPSTELSYGTSSPAESTALTDDLRAMESSSSQNNNRMSIAQGAMSIEDNARVDSQDVAGSASSANVNEDGVTLSLSSGFGTEPALIESAMLNARPRSSDSLSITTTTADSAAAGPSRVIPSSDVPLEPAEQNSPSAFEVTDLDLLLNLLDDETRTVDGSAYNELLALGDLLGPAQASEGRSSTATAVEDLGNVFLGKVALDRRRVTKDGRTKLKLSLFGVVVDKCTICLTQFKEGAWACLLPCQHAFHEKCCRRWLLRSASCPLCRSAVT
ncbi:hypothetical protein SCHPADRAFT_71245 [Schizopora paradoxa]|uniref:RING-type domain-containing protein n=1 Tax=Schizopora paradoxa TaxID=27342 RepID=A0A0H2S505_9AGAM|nr:hypothetical protein SCHPADRAFT_71245 [Schizopora paradoxa]